MPAAARAALIILVFTAAFAARLELLWRAEASATVPSYIGTTQTVTGTVATDPDARDTSVRVNVRVSAIANSPEKGVVLAVLPKGTTLAYGDTVEISGAITAPQAFVTDTGRVFDYPGYLRVQGVGAIMQKATLLSRTPGPWSLRGALFDLKRAFERSLERVLPPQDAALLEGILLGERRGLPNVLTVAFIIASLIHVVVLSGYNISIVAEATLRFLRFLPRTLGYGLGVVLMLLFVLMTGAGSTSVRAGIMAFVAIVARYLRRPAAAMRSLLFAAALLALYNPLVVLYDPSFILSVLATFGLIALAPWVESRLPKFLTTHEQIRSIAASTIAVQIYVLPALLYYTGTLSFVALPANLLALPLIPFAMLAGFAAGLLGFVHPLLSLVPALLSDLVLRWIMFVAQTAAHLPLGHTTVPPFGGGTLLLIYVPLTWLALRAYGAYAKSMRKQNKSEGGF